MENKYKNINFRINEDLFVEMDELRSKGLNWSAVLRDFIRETIAKNNSKKPTETVSQ